MRSKAFGALCLVLGCAETSYRYTSTTRNAASAKAAGCDFELYTTRPAEPYVELGVLEPIEEWTKNVSQFKERVGPQVCAAGGDAVLTEINGYGAYMRGTVIKYKDAPTQADAQSPSAVPFPPPPPGMTAAFAGGTPVDVRSAPFEIAPVTTVVQPGQRFWVVPSPTNGWRAATLADGRHGYVRDAQIKMERSP